MAQSNKTHLASCNCQRAASPRRKFDYPEEQHHDVYVSATGYFCVFLGPSGTYYVFTCLQQWLNYKCILAEQTGCYWILTHYVSRESRTNIVGSLGFTFKFVPVVTKSFASFCPSRLFPSF